MHDAAKPELGLSKRVQSMPEALSIYINNLILKLRSSGKHVITLSLGEPYFDLPLEGFTQEEMQTGLHYSDSLGIPELRARIADYYGQTFRASIDPNSELIVSAGSKPLIFMALQTILEPDDEVLIHEPAWLSYPEQVKLAGGVPVYIPCSCNARDFGKYVTSRTKAIILNNPNNPAGRVYSSSELEAVYSIFRANGAYVIVDESYGDFCNDGVFESMASLVPEKDDIIVINSLSKCFGMSGWRIGFCIANPEVVYGILKLNQHLITCAPTMLQHYVARNFDNIRNAVSPQIKAVVELRERVKDHVEEAGFRTMGGSATFYLFVDVSEYGRQSLDLAMHLLFKHGIGVVPGSAYGSSTEGFVRIGVGVESYETIVHAIDVMRDVVVSGAYDKECVATGLASIGCKRFAPTNYGSLL